MREFDRGTRGRFLRKAVPRHRGGDMNKTMKTPSLMHKCLLVTTPTQRCTTLKALTPVQTSLSYHYPYSRAGGHKACSSTKTEAVALHNLVRRPGHALAAKEKQTGVNTRPAHHELPVVQFRLATSCCRFGTNPLQRCHICRRAPRRPKQPVPGSGNRIVRWWAWEAWRSGGAWSSRRRHLNPPTLAVAW